MASIQGLQKALDSKTFDPSDFTQDQLILVDELIKTGNLQGYGSINDVIKERAGAAVGVAQEKQKKIQPFQQATKEAGFEVERADLELVGDVSGSAFAFLQDRDKLVSALKKGMGSVEFGVDREALNYRSMQFDKYENLLKNAPIVRNIKPFARVAGVVGKMADGFRQIKKAGASPFLQTEMKSIAFGTGGAGIGSLAFDAANYATDFTAASSMDLAELTDDDVAKLPPGQREAYHALEAMNNSMIFNAGAAGLGPLLQLASGGVKKVLGLSTPEVEQLARYTKETGVPTNLFALADPNAGFLARGMKNILNVVGVFPATAGPGMKYKQEIEEETFKAVLDHLNAGAPYSHAELLSLGTLNQFKKNFADYKDVIAMKYDTVFKEADLLGPDLKIIPIQNLGKATENVINSLKAQYPSDMGLQLDKRISELTEFDDPIVKFIAATKEYTNGLTEGLTAKEYIGLNKMLTAAYGDTKIYDPRGLVAQINHALKADFNTVAEAPSIKVLMNDNKQVKEAYDNVVKSQGESGGQLYVQNLINGVKGVQKELLDANDFFTKTTSTFKSPVASKIKQVDANLFSNLGLLGVQGKYTVNPDELWSKTLKQIFRNGSKDSIEQMKFLLGYDKGGPGKEIFDRFKQLYMFDAFQYAFKKKPDLTGEPLFDLMDKARDRGVIMKKYVDELNPSLTADIRIQRGVDPKALLASKLGDQKFVDFKFQADKVAGFDPNMFEANLGLVGDSATVTTGKNRLIAMYGGGAEGKKGFDQLSKIIQLMKANASYTIGDPSTFVKRRAVLGGMGAIAGGILPFAAATTVGIVPTLAFVFLSRYAGAVLSNPKSVEALFDVLNPTLKIEKAIAGKLDLSKKRVFAALLNNAMDEDKDAPKVDPNLINAEEITNYLLRKPPQMPNARFNISALPKNQMERMYPELTAISKTPGPELAGYQNFVRGAAIARQKDEAASFIESQIPDPTGPRQAMNMQQRQGQQGQQPMIPQMRQPMQTQVAQNPALFRALNPQDTLGQAIVERQSGTV